MDGAKVIVTIGPDGKATVEAAGVKGPACKELTRPIEKALGIVTSDTPTGDMKETATSHGTSQQARA